MEDRQPPRLQRFSLEMSGSKNSPSHKSNYLPIFFDFFKQLDVY